MKPTFSVTWWTMSWCVGASVAVFAALPRQQVVLRRAVLLYGVVLVVVFAVPNPLGGNVYDIQTYNGHFLTAVDGGNRITDTIHSDATRVGSWERFTVTCGH